MKVDTCQVKVDSDGKTFITTDLEGELIAFYPVSAVKIVYSDKEEKEVMWVPIPSVQSGRFADANILTGEIDGDSNEVTLEPETSLLRFYVDKSIRVKSIKVTSPSNYINDDENSPTVTTVTAPEGKTLDEVTDDPGKRICYVAVSYEASINDVKFEIETETQNKVEKITKVNGKFLRGKMYNVFIPYYIEVNVGTDLAPIYQKWAYCNIGAFLPEEAGDCFSWAEVMGHTPVQSVFTFPENNPDSERYTGGWTASSGFAECNTPYFVNNSYGKYNASDNLTGLESVDDAASVNWGNGWKMPTDTALQVLAGAQRKWDGSKKGYFFGTESYTVFFPVTGYGEDNILESEEQLGAYWSSVLSSEAIGGKDKAVYLLLKIPNSNAIVPDTFDIVGAGATADTDIYTTSAERYYGLPIRPIYDPELKDDTKGTINGHEYVVIAGKKWATQNLAVSASGQMKWKGKNSTAVKTPVTNEDVVVGDYFQWAASYDGYGITTDNPQPDSLLVYESFTNMYCVDGGATDYKTSVFTFRTGKGFSKDCAPYVDGNSYCKYISSGDQLELTDDTANILWGETWRMPTVEDINSLYAATYWAYDSEDKGFYVFSPDANHMGGNYSTDLSGLNKADALLFFPNAGVGEPGYSTVYDLGSRARYWYNSTYSYYTNYFANIMHIYSASTLQIADAHKDRFNGCSIRPVSN